MFSLFAAELFSEVGSAMVGAAQDVVEDIFYPSTMTVTTTTTSTTNNAAKKCSIVSYKHRWYPVFETIDEFFLLPPKEFTDAMNSQQRFMDAWSKMEQLSSASTSSLMRADACGKGLRKEIDHMRSVQSRRIKLAIKILKETQTTNTNNFYRIQSIKRRLERFQQQLEER